MFRHHWHYFKLWYKCRFYTVNWLPELLHWKTIRHQRLDFQAFIYIYLCAFKIQIGSIATITKCENLHSEFCWILFKKKFEGHQSFYWEATDTPVLGFWWCLAWVSKPGGFLTCILPCLCATDFSDSHLMQHLLTSWWLAWQPSLLIHVLVHAFYWILTIEVMSFIRWRSLNSNCCCLTGAPVEPVDLGNGQL